MSSYTLPTLAKGYRFTINNCAAINLWMKWNRDIKQRQPFTRRCMRMSKESFQWMKGENRQEMILKACYKNDPILVTNKHLGLSQKSV